MKSKRKALIITLGLIWSFLLVFVPITGYFTGLQADKKSESGGANFNPNNKTQIESFNGLFIIGEVTSIDPLSFSYRMSLFITPVGSFSKDQKLAQPIVFFVNGKPTPFEGNQYTSNRDVIVTFSTGDSNHYPFDVYTDTIHVHAQTGNASDPQPVPIAIVVGGNVQGILSFVLSFGTNKVSYDASGWNQLPIIESTETGTSIFLTISRTETVKFFSIFIVILM